MKATGVLKIALRVLLGLVVLVVAAYLAFMVFAMYGPRLSGGTRGKHIREHGRFASQFRAGDTNAPLLAMDWFSDHGVYFCRVSQSGNVRSARDVGHAIQGGSGISSRFSLDSTNRPLLEAAINALPVSSSKSLPKERQILVSGIRSNQWFERVYDRANVPAEVERLYELTDAYLGWFIPKVEGREIGRLHSANFSGSFVAVSTDAAIAVSAGQWVTNNAYYYPPMMEVWSLANGGSSAAPALKLIPEVQSYGNAFAITPDGNTIAVATHYGLYVADWKSGKILWQAGALDHDNYHGKCIAIGDKGRTLYTAGAHIVERWDLLSGRKLGSLGTNELIVKFLKVSQDGSTLVAGFGSFNASATSFGIWESGKDESAVRFSSLHGASVGISPDGQTLVLCHWPERKLEIWNWRSGSKTQVPLRVPYASGSAYSMHWSPDGKRLAAYVDTYPASIIVYETASWKPLAQWCCGQIGGHSEFVVRRDGKLLQLMGGQINSLDLTAIKSVAD
jgi:hypothetical protein